MKKYEIILYPILIIVIIRAIYLFMIGWKSAENPSIEPFEYFEILIVVLFAILVGIQIYRYRKS